MLKVGTFELVSRITRRPFGNEASSARGSFTFRTFLLTGALPLMTAPLVCPAGPGWGAAWPYASDETSATSISATMKLLIFFVILISSLAPSY
jgi:hypothetical protein